MLVLQTRAQGQDVNQALLMMGTAVLALAPGTRPAEIFRYIFELLIFVCTKHRVLSKFLGSL